MNAMYLMWCVLFLLIAVLRIREIRRDYKNSLRPTSDEAIAAACNADESSNDEREFLSPDALQYLYDEYSTDNHPRTKADRHIARLYKMLDSNSLDFEGRRWIYNEIWDIKIATAATVTK